MRWLARAREGAAGRITRNIIEIAQTPVRVRTLLLPTVAVPAKVRVSMAKVKLKLHSAAGREVLLLVQQTE